MTVKHLKFPSIEQFRGCVHNVTSRSQWVGRDENGDSVYDTSKQLPSLLFQGTVKLHGTNAAVALDADGNMWCQSRENIITPQSDNAGFAMHVHSNRILYSTMLEQARLVTNITTEESLLIFGEWCGGNIQKNIGLSQLPKMFVVFKIARVDADDQRHWFTPAEIELVFSRTEAVVEEWTAPVYHIYQFPVFMVEVNFSRPHDAQQVLSDLTIAVEDECPVAKQLGAVAENGPMVGEGIVWQCVNAGYENSGYWFKVKGEKHAPKSKMKTFNPVDAERVDAINDLATQVTPEWRLEQMLQETFNTLNGGLLDIKRMGDYIKAVIQDIVKEDLDIVAASGFTMKEVNGSISKIARDFMLKQMEFKDPV